MPGIRTKRRYYAKNNLAATNLSLTSSATRPKASRVCFPQGRLAVGTAEDAHRGAFLAF